MLDIIKNRIDINDFNIIIHSKEYIQHYVFDIIDMVLNNVEYLPYLESIFIELKLDMLSVLKLIFDISSTLQTPQSSRAEKPIKMYLLVSIFLPKINFSPRYF